MLVPACAFLLVFYLVPLLQVLLLSFQQSSSWSLIQYGHVFSDPVQLTVLGETFGLAFGVATLCLMVGYPVAYLLVTCGEKVRRLVILLIIASVWTSILVRTYSWMVLLGRQGAINTLLQSLGLVEEPLQLLYTGFSVYVGMTHIMLPFMILPLYTVMQRIDLRLVRSARSLGAGRMAAFWTVFFPLSLPGILAGTVLVFIVSIGFFITPALLGGIDDTTFVMLIEKEVSQFLNWELAAAMSVVLVCATLVLVYLYQYLLSTEHAVTKARRNPLSRIVDLVLRNVMKSKMFLATHIPGDRLKAVSRLSRVLSRFGAMATRILPWLVITFLIAPLFVIFPLSFSSAPFLEFPPSSYSLRWYESLIGREDWIIPIATSIRVAIAVVIISTVLGVLAAIPIARAKTRLGSIAAGFLLSPIIMPVVVLAVSMHFYYSSLNMSGTLPALIFGHTVLAIPFVVIVMTNALKSVDENLERVARTLGATAWAAFSRVTMVLVRPAVLTAALFAFLASFDELVIALFLSGPKTTTLPKRLWDAIREEIDPTTAAVAASITLISVSLMLLAEYARRKSIRALETNDSTLRAGVSELRRRGVFR